jgi:hypothetical protein
MTKNIVKGKGSGFVTGEGKICMERCFKCARENYAMAVMSGGCAWCGYDANEPQLEVVKDE